MHGLDTYKFKMDWINTNKNIKTSSSKSSENIQKIEGRPDRSVSDNTKRKKMETFIFHRLKGSELCGLWSDLAQFQIHPSSYACHHYL